MNEAAKLVADSALGIHFTTIFLNGEVYSVHPPTLKIICRSISHWSEMSIDTSKEQTLSNVYSQIPSNYKPILRGLAVMIVGDVKFWELKSYRLYISWLKGRILPNELKAAKDAIMPFTAEAAKDFFDCAASLQNVVGMAAKAK